MTNRRSTRARNNDAAIRDATIDLIGSVGIDAISFRDVGRVAGLTHGALYARFEDVEELLVDLWNEILRHQAITIFEAVVVATASPSGETVKAIFEIVREQSRLDVAMTEVLLTSRRFVILHEEVESFIHDYLETMPPGFTPALQSRALTLFALMMIEILVCDQIGLEGPDLDFLETIVLQTLRTPTEDVKTVDLVEPVDRVIPLPDRDIRSQLTYFTFSAVGKSGYAKATISRISRRAKCSPGAIYKIFPSKEDLVIEAIRKLMTAPWIAIVTLAEILDEGKIAQQLYSAASEANSLRKHFTLEVSMAAAHNEKIRSAAKSQLEGLELLVPMFNNVNEAQRNEIRYLIRSIVFLSLGVSYLSTITKITDQLDFNQFAEPFRRALLIRNAKAWPTIKTQLLDLASPTSSSPTRNVD